MNLKMYENLLLSSVATFIPRYIKGILPQFLFVRLPWHTMGKLISVCSSAIIFKWGINIVWTGLARLVWPAKPVTDSPASSVQFTFKNSLLPNLVKKQENRLRLNLKKFHFGTILKKNFAYSSVTVRSLAHANFAINQNFTVSFQIYP